MSPRPAVTRRPLPGSPFKDAPAHPPAESFAVRDRVTHDRHGLGTVVGIEDAAVLVDFGSENLRRVPLPSDKLSKL